jgi:hypothetical protein
LSFWQELAKCDAEDWTAMGLCQLILTLLLFIVLSIGNWAGGAAFPPPQPVASIKLGPVYNFVNRDDKLQFNTTKQQYYEEEGFEFEWTEGEYNNLSLNATHEQMEKMSREFPTNKGKSHWVTYIKDTNELVSFYPAE